jgi:hypothetical protein
MSLNLALLSASEVLFHVCLTTDYSGLLSGVCRYPLQAHIYRAQLIVASAASLFADVFLCTRNWCHVIISSARAEVVLRPLRTKTFLTRSVSIKAYCVVLCVSLLVSTVRAFAERLLICSKTAALIPLWLGTDLFKAFEICLFFLLQTLAPVLLVVTSSLLIALRLAKGPPPQAPAPRKKQAKATRTVLLLAAIFAAMESPTIVFGVLSKTSPDLLGPEGATAVSVVCEAAILIDSVLNLVVFSTSGAAICCRERKEKEGRNRKRPGAVPLRDIRIRRGL